MKDKIKLIAFALVFAGLAWLFWHLAGLYGFLIVLALSVLALYFSNKPRKPPSSGC